MVFVAGTLFFSVTFLGLFFFYSKSKDQVALEYGLDEEELALYSSCIHAVSEGNTRFFSELSPVEGCACLVSRLKKKNYSTYLEIFYSMAEAKVRKQSETANVQSKNDANPSINNAPTLVELKAFTDFAANVEYCARLN